VGACKGAWHAHCYQQLALDNFPVLATVDLEQSIVNDEAMEEEDPMRFREARDGDHLMCPFQCDDCQFWNRCRRAPIPKNIYDTLRLVCIRRAILDAFWARERSTVLSNRREGIRFLLNSERMGDWDPYPARGPWPLEDTFGVQMSGALLLRSLDEGRNAPKVQFETVRRLRAHLSNFVHTTPTGVGPSFIGEEGGVAAITNSPTNSMWFRRFMKGMHKRMGDVWIPDRPLTIGEIKASLQILEEDWKLYLKVHDGHGLQKAGLTAIVLISGFFAALRGEEIVRIDIGSMRHHWTEAMGCADGKHVPLMLAGRFKRETGEKLFCQPLATESKSGVKIAEWFHRTLWILGKLGTESGPMFRSESKGGSKYKKASVGDLDHLLHSILGRVQKNRPEIIGASVDVMEEYSASRSMRRGATSEAQNAEIPKEVIEANNRWRKHMRSRGLTPGMSMMERYSDAKASVPSLTRFSRSL
jgi:hypothetical protein